MNRIGLRGITLYAVMLLLLAAKPSNVRADLVVDGPAADEIEMLEELAHWIDADADPGEPLPLRIRERSTSFEVFHSFHGAAQRQERLADLPFGPAIRRVAERNGLDGLLIAAIVEVESGFDPSAVSHRGARGLMQVMPASVPADLRERLFEPEPNLEVGAAYLRQLLDRYNGDLELTLAAYNAGPTNVRRYGGVPPFRETRRYVEKVLELYVAHHREIWQESDTGDRLALLDPVESSG